VASKDDKNKTLPTHVVGIGASAGGLEALQDFFGNLPSDTQAAYVVVQHLSPDYKSMMSELLSKHTDIPIFPVKDSIIIEARAIYLMPPRKNMLIADGKLLLSDQMPDTHPHMSIDVFLRSLAEDQQHKAIGVILSGTGSDGTRGIRAMKESGGLVVVQEPESAKFDGMPKSAYNTGLADLVLSAKEMGKSLVNYMNHPSISGDIPVIQYASAEGDDDTLAEIFALLKQKSSINFSQYKPSTVSRRIERRISINKLTSLDAYLRLLLESPREVQILNRELLINVTRFFRDEEAFDKLTHSVVEKILKTGNSDEPVRLWVAGCSSGEEAYSIAMIFDEMSRQHSIERQVKIFATDVDEEAISEASNGLYSAEIVDDITAERLEYYFDAEGESYRVSPQLRKMVIFAQHNMIEDPPFSNINLVSCRNALIYFQQAAQQKVFASFYFALQQNGFLFLGNSESLGSIQAEFDVIDERTRLFQKVGITRLPIPSNSLIKSDSVNASQSMIMPSLPLASRPSRMVINNKYNAVMERLIEHYAPDCIVLNDSFDAVLVYGDVSRYTKGLASGKVSTNIKELIRDNLSVAISTALYRSEKNGEDVFYNDVGFVVNDEEIAIDIAVFVVKQSEHQNAPRSYVLQFIEHLNVPQPPKKKLVKAITFNASEQSQQRIDDLEQELIKKQEHLQVTVEELETTNEELQSANEELMSANEEMQSTNEELQSVNEELYTVNSEYQEKINQLTEANVDLDSVINSTDIGIIFLDQHLTIRKFTPHATNYVNMRASDIGRPIHHISHELDFPELLTEIATVSTDGSEIERDVLTKSGQAALIRIMPYAKKEYLSQTNQGVLITITNISRLKFVENALAQAQQQFKAVIQGRSEKLLHRIQKSNNVSVLIVDDDKVDRESMVRFLKADSNHDYSVFSASTKEEGLATLNRVKIDVILLDYMLSECTAADFSREARAAHEDTPPIILLSGQDEANMDETFLSDGIIDSINKEDLSGQLLVKVIDYTLERNEVKEIMQKL
jgi:two-component system CheB/CheR fusion protein